MIGEDFNSNSFGGDLAPPAITPAPTPNPATQPSPLAGLSSNYRDVVGQIESSGGTQIGNGGGKYQFMPATAKQYGGSDDAAMDRLTADNVKVLRNSKLPVNDVTAYVAHQQGAGGARALLTAAPDTVAADVVGEKNAQGNRPFFYAKDGTPLTVAQSLEVYNAKVKGAGSKAAAIVPTAAPGVPAEVNAVDAPKTTREKLRSWAQEYVLPAKQEQQAESKPAAAPEKEEAAPPVATVPVGQATSGVVRSGGKVLFQRYGRTFDAHGNLVG